MAFAVRTDDPLPGGISAITNTASIADDGSNGADPTPDDNTATDTDRSLQPTAIPTLGEWSMVAMALMLAGMALWQLRRLLRLPPRRVG